MGSRIELQTYLFKSLKRFTEMVIEATEAPLCLAKPRCAFPFAITMFCSPGLHQHLHRHTRATGSGTDQCLSPTLKGVKIIISLIVNRFVEEYLFPPPSPGFSKLHFSFPQISLREKDKNSC